MATPTPTREAAPAPAAHPRTRREKALGDAIAETRRAQAEAQNKLDTLISQARTDAQRERQEATAAKGRVAAQEKIVNDKIAELNAEKAKLKPLIDKAIQEESEAVAHEARLAALLDAKGTPAPAPKPVVVPTEARTPVQPAKAPAAAPKAPVKAPARSGIFGLRRAA